MILVDTSIWVDHLRRNDERLAELLRTGQILIHPFVLGEIALGNLRQRALILSSLGELPTATMADDAELLGFIDAQSLYGSGMGYIDVHLLASARLMPGTALWTRDRRLEEAARRLGVAAII